MYDLLKYAYEDLKSMDNVKIEKMKRDSKILKLENEKQQLISFLKIKLKRITNQQEEETGLDFAYSEGYIDMIKEVLDFVNRGGKDE